jgi:hypothetical protein
MNNSMRFLHQKFCEEASYIISYTAFCRLRPFWVVSQRINERDTCLCVQHENIHLIHRELRKFKIVADEELDLTITKMMCCDIAEIHCYLRRCEACKQKTIVVDLFDHIQSELVSYESWGPVHEVGKDGKTYRRTVKQKLKCSIVQLLDRFFDLLINYSAHIGRIKNQYREMRNLRDNLTSDDAIVHIDFSENYACKYYREIQSIHFGGNRSHISLHTGVLYAAKNVFSFCTISENLSHNPVLIWAHLHPILIQYTHVKTIHFQSDSPTSQYRNKGMMYILFHKVLPLFPELEVLTWNFTESAHGKGAADGVGGTIKRTCDRIVAQNVRDISSFEEFSELVRSFKSKIAVIEADHADKTLEEDIKLAPEIKGNSIHFACNISHSFCLNFFLFEPRHNESASSFLAL